jgi:hypothetical protein
MRLVEEQFSVAFAFFFGGHGVLGYYGALPKSQIAVTPSGIKIDVWY